MRTNSPGTRPRPQRTPENDAHVLVECCEQPPDTLHAAESVHEQPDCALHVDSAPKLPHGVGVPLQAPSPDPAPSPDEEESEVTVAS